ncbi:SDR family NAD(P)-dependent oxidoreductase [Marivirga sp. S37H4]|uniref:SDR family NAD(P)-dependent oxidoreductase n=1 Tax=Marivirga aurantiaca TaxID=2802615 RepID=A0A934WYQ8_9BACT|nr:SDR family NAD(P)-dependent oxidoreductase [Marivirga aurantiaca]MBK6265371.1 SDR family NAD(P)-dependent oxidoreductase [Marivirga aurantiaca]
MKTLFFITGSSKGIGKGLAERALQDKASKVIGLSRTHTIEHDHYKGINIDLSEISQLEKNAYDLLSAEGEFERIVLINNAGTLGDVKHMGNIDPSAITHLFNLNVTAPIILMNAFMKVFKDFKGEKIIINVSSGAGKSAVDGWSGYCASKAALDMATEVTAKENKMDNGGFRIHAIAPGVVDTEMQTQIRSTDKSDFSGVERFRSLKEDQQLSSESEVAEKYFSILNNPDKYTEAILDVRNV